MDSLFVNMFNFIYISVIVLGGITLTLTLILQRKERDRRHRAIFFFVGAIFVYMIVDFVTYYYLEENVPGGLVFSMITISDLLLYLLIIAWVNLLCVLVNGENPGANAGAALGSPEKGPLKGCAAGPVKVKWVIIGTLCYQVFSQVLSISLGRYDSYSLQVEGGAGKVILLLLSIVYSLGIIGVCGFYLIQLLRAGQKGGNRNVTMILILLLMGYMVWITYWDYNAWYRTENRLIDIYAMDPLILLYAVFNVLLIYYFYKKDPLKLQGSQIAPEDAVAAISRMYQLSAREQEVLDLVNRGMSNPQIAAELSISENTVKRHVNNVFRKTETQSRHEILFKISNINEIDLM